MNYENEQEYDEDFENVMSELQANFGWSNIDVLPDSYKGLLNDTIKAVKNCSIPNVVGRSEQLCDYCKKPLENTCCNDCLEEMGNHNH